MIVVQKERNLQGGFSLIELIIVITIIGILAAGVIGGGMRWVRTARRNTTITKLQQTKAMIEGFYGEIGQYPATLEDLVRKPQDPKLAKQWAEPYMKSVPKDPWQHEIQYKVNAKGAARPYELWSFGPGGENAPETEWITVEE